MPSCRCATTAACSAQISSKFGQKEGEFWNSNLEIVGIDRVTRGRVPAVAARRRRSRAGSATALPASPTARATPIHYSILENSGWLGVGWGVEWCVVGLDRNWAYNPGLPHGAAVIADVVRHALPTGAGRLWMSMLCS